jgi:phosphoenolpyruvate carboxykinase (GTP)
MEMLFEVNPESWKAEAEDTQAFFDMFEGRVPAPVQRQLEVLRQRLGD